MISRTHTHWYLTFYVLLFYLFYIIDFTYNIRQHISSLRGTQELPEDGDKLPKHVGAQG
jgi:flagellar biosynthesis protein FlhB